MNELYDRSELEINDCYNYYDFEQIHKKDLVEKDSLIGEHIISGCEYTNDSLGFRAMIFILDGQTYLATCDPDDGYRSYLGGFFKTERQCHKNLPDIHIEIQHQVKREIISAYERRDYKGYGFIIKDPRFKEDILIELGTDYSEDYYPTCVMHYMPENIKEVQ